ncbi:hypothetical protein NX875_28990, partial [Burkholderia thailandensis]|nr:hypothetical protein [Burkholderia thailandensis]
YVLRLIQAFSAALESALAAQLLGPFVFLATLCSSPAHHLTPGDDAAVFTEDAQPATVSVSLREWVRHVYAAPAAAILASRSNEFVLTKEHAALQASNSYHLAHIQRDLDRPRDAPLHHLQLRRERPARQPHHPPPAERPAARLAGSQGPGAPRVRPEPGERRARHSRTHPRAHAGLSHERDPAQRRRD